LKQLTAKTLSQRKQ